MAVQYQTFVIGSGRTYPSTKYIATKQHMAVFVRLEADGTTWSQLNVDAFQLITNSAVIERAFDMADYDMVEVRVADDPDELLTSPDDISTVVDLKDEIIIVVGIADEIVDVVGMEAEIKDLASDPLRQAVLGVTTDPLKQAVLDAEGNATSAQNSADASQASAVASEASYQNTLLVEQQVVAQGDIQDARVIAEGDTQVARVLAAGDEGYVDSRNSEAEAMTSDSWANEAPNTDVKDYYYDEPTDSILYNTIVGARSAIHWSTIAQVAASGLTFQGTWDSVACSLPPTPVAPSVNDTVNGFFYIVASVTGDTTGCPDLSIGDWLVWSGDIDGGDLIVEGSWQLINWTFDWTAIQGVTVGGLPTQQGDDLLPTTGGDMTGELVMEDVAVRYHDSLGIAKTVLSGDDNLFYIDMYNSTGAWAGRALNIDRETAAVNFVDVCPTASISPTVNNHLTRKDYVDTKLPLAGGTMTGALIMSGSDTDIAGITFAFNDNVPQAIFDINGEQFRLLTPNAPTTVAMYFATTTGGAYFNAPTPPVAIGSPTAVSHLTRKDYVDAGANPIGAIIMFNGTFANIPANWQLCDGTNGTPDMNGRFPLGANVEADIGNIGGSNNAVNISHTHDFTGDLMPEHTHTTGIVGGGTDWSSDTNACNNGSTGGTSAGTPTGTVSTDGADGTGLNRPAYVQLAYIQRMS